jgi:hypothetical protein
MSSEYRRNKEYMNNLSRDPEIGEEETLTEKTKRSPDERHT